MPNPTAEVYHTIFLSVCVGGLATNTTIYVLLGVEHSLFFLSLITIFRTKRNLTDDKLESLTTDVQLLVIGESLEIVIPLAYLLCFTAAYYGPNSNILGNVKNGYWQFSAVNNLWGPTKNLLILVTVDSISFTLVTIFLYCAVNINLFNVFIHLMKEYGKIFSIHIAYLMDQLFCMIAVACALDFTFQFDWVLDQEKWQNITGIGNITGI